MSDLTKNKKLERPAIAAQLWSVAQHGGAWAAAAGGKGGELPVAPVGREAEAFGDHAMFVASHTLALLQADRCTSAPSAPSTSYLLVTVSKWVMPDLAPHY
jgi:hypothetical protein